MEGEGEVKLGQRFGLTNLRRFSGKNKKMKNTTKTKTTTRKKRAFKDLSAPPLVLASEIKIHSSCRCIKNPARPFYARGSTLRTWTLALQKEKKGKETQRTRESCGAGAAGGRRSEPRAARAAGGPVPHLQRIYSIYSLND